MRWILQRPLGFETQGDMDPSLPLIDNSKDLGHWNEKEYFNIFFICLVGIVKHVLENEPCDSDSSLDCVDDNGCKMKPTLGIFWD